MIRLTHDQRRIIILDAAVKVAKEQGVYMVTHEKVAKECAVPTSKPTVRKMFPTKLKLWTAFLHYINDHEMYSMARSAGWVDTNDNKC